MYLSTRECSAVTGIPVRSLEAFRTAARFELDKGKAPAFTRNVASHPVYPHAAVNNWIEAEYQKARDLYAERLERLAEFINDNAPLEAA